MIERGGPGVQLRTQVRAAGITTFVLEQADRVHGDDARIGLLGELCRPLERSASVGRSVDADHDRLHRWSCARRSAWIACARATASVPGPPLVVGSNTWGAATIDASVAATDDRNAPRS